MKVKFKDYIIVVLILLGIFQIFQWVNGISFDKTEKIIVREIETSQFLYQRGREWGEINAQYAIDNELISSEEDVNSLIVTYLNNPAVDISCYYAPGYDGDEDCIYYPDLSEINEKYNVYEHKTTNFALYAFQSGFIDGFRLLIEDY